MRVLTKNNMDTVTETRDLLGEAFSFYKQLYAAQPCDETIQAEFLEGAYPELVEDARDSCEGEITTEELKKAVEAMEKDKSPGLDGITTNFYKHFWHMLGDKLVQVYNYAFRVGHLSVSQQRGVISLLFKKGDRTQLKNWRPITLLTTDYKILSKALANRLHGVLPLIIHSDQTASIRGRAINDNARLLHDVISYANTNSVPLAVVSIDQMKALDRVSHDFLFKCLKRFGFGPSFIQWIQLLYTSVSSSVRVNGWLTAFVHLERGLRQGCPLSMPLYVLTAETMAINIRSNPLIHGVKPPKSQNEVKLSQFADDTTLLLTDEQSIIETFRVFDQYELASGAKISKSKCKGLWSGDFSDRTDQLFDFSWYNDYIPDKILGQFFGNVDCSLLNWNAKVQKIDNIIAAWRQRDLSYKGKALIINSLLTSSLWYNVTSLAVPPWVIMHIERAVYNFFWSNKHPLVNREVLALPLKEGGFNIPRLETKVRAFRLNIIRRLLSGEDAHWKCFTSYFLRISNMDLGKLSLVLDYPLQRIDGNIPAFHKELLSAWLKHEPRRFRTNVPTIVTDILNEPLFLNKENTLHNELLFFKDWIAAGVIKISDICYEVVPGFLPIGAIHEILADQTGSDGRTFEKTSREFDKILSAIPQQWTDQIRFELGRPPPTLQPCFAIRTAGPSQTPTEILSCKTRHFYGQLHDQKKPVIPAVDRWKASLQPEPTFSSSQWKTLYSPLVSNKQGDTNWKISHRVLPTALSLSRMGILSTPNCHRCGAIDNIEHAMLECRAVHGF